MSTNPTQIRQAITAQIIAALEKGVRPWVRPWRPDINMGRPTSVASGKPYTGINPLILQMHAVQYGFTSKWWGTYKQWESLGGQVQHRPSHVAAGKWGATAIFYKPITKKVKVATTGEEKEEQFPLLRTFTLFNADQVDGVPQFQAEKDYGDGPWVPNWEPAEALLTATKSEIRCGSDQAFYRPPQPEGTWPYHKSGDFIQLPSRHQFDHPGHFYETAFHELAHWSEVRLGWERRGNADYPMGELIAEIASCFVCAELAIPGREGIENNIAYLQSWLEAMKNDSNYIFQASSQASKVADFLMGFVRDEEDKLTEPANST